MELTAALQKLDQLQRKQLAYSHAMGLIDYDGMTAAPSGTAANRAETLGILAEEVYKLSTGDETVALLDELHARMDELDEVHQRIVKVMYKNIDETRRIPMEEYVAYQKLTTESDAIWHTAKESNDYALFMPYLERLIAQTQRIMRYIKPDQPVYDTLLDRFETGLTRAKCDAFFDVVRRELVPFIHRVTAAKQVDDSPLHGHFPLDKQRQLSDYLMQVIGLDRAHCTIAETEHPFTTGFTKYDVRITTHYLEDNFASSMYSVIHEGGHALYDTHPMDRLAYTVLGGGVSMGIHESQSRFYENIIGRSRGFIRLIAPKLRELFPETAAYDDEALYRAFNRAEPSLIRTEADELTYSLHIMVRYELEKALMQGTLTVADLPAAWNAKYKEYLGVDVPDDTHGCLQDIHWAMGDMGYFPSYALGSAYSAQAVDDLRKTMDLDAQWAEGNMQPLKDALRSRVWQHGRAKEPQWLVQSLCGGAFDAAHYTNYLKNKYTELYGL